MPGTIMIVEESKDVHELYKGVFKETDYDVVIVGEIRDAWKEIRKCKPDLIILDIVLDGSAGDLLFVKLKTNEIYRDIPTIVVSVIDKEVTKHLNAENTEFIYLEKPFSKQRLLEEIAKKIKSKNKQV